MAKHRAEDPDFQDGVSGHIGNTDRNKRGLDKRQDDAKKDAEAAKKREEGK